MSTIARAKQREERARLHHPFATISLGSRGRKLLEADDAIRTCFERDGHRILHAKPFRRMRNKTQVFFSPENDHIATRMDHSLYVATISRTICRALGLNDDLAFAAALGHDLGHAPFGHSGERILETLLNRETEEDVEYTHEGQSLRVVDLLTTMTGYAHVGLNLTYEVRDAIRCHCGEGIERVILPRQPLEGDDPATFVGRTTFPITLEGCVMRMADRIAYLGRDYEDAQIALGSDLPPLPKTVAQTLGNNNREIINVLVVDVIEQNQQTPDRIGFSEPIFEVLSDLREFNYHNIYNNDRLEEYRVQTDAILTRIFDVLLDHLVRRERDQWDVARPDSPLHVKALASFIRGVRYAEQQAASRVVLDFISLMTDGYAFKIFKSIALPDPIV